MDDYGLKKRRVYEKRFFGVGEEGDVCIFICWLTGQNYLSDKGRCKHDIGRYFHKNHWSGFPSGVQERTLKV